jgi:murein DD-endopeptidase MepM/ murein hydrolase activator NlpD
MTIVLNPPLEGVVRVTQGFGWRPAYYAQFGLPGHEGIDFVGSGIHTLAAADGLVTEVGWHNGNIHHAYGYNVRLQHNIDGDVYRTIYAHGKPGSELVHVGYRVTAGQPLIQWDSTGNVQGAHLHISLTLDGATAQKRTTWPLDIIDPTPFLQGNAPETIFPFDVKVIAFDGLRVRTGPGLAFQKVETLPLDDVETVNEAVAADNLQWGRIGAGQWIALLYTQRVKA